MSGGPVRELSVVVPCCNEIGNLSRYPDELFGELSRLSIPTQVVFVDDGSTDGTPSGLERFASRPGVTILRHERNRGLGAALRTGFSACAGDAIVALDADLTFHPKEIPALLSAYTSGVDIVIGSPFRGRMAGVHPVRRALSASVNGIYRFLLGAHITATSSIFRLYRTEALQRLSLVSEGFDINAEILVKTLRGGGRVVEVPVTLGRRTAGVSKINVRREIRNHLRMLARIALWKIKGKRSACL